MHEKDYPQHAREYLLSFPNINKDILDKQLNNWKLKKPKNMPQLYKAFLSHVPNRQGMGNSIGAIDALKGILYNFNPKQVLQHYPTWQHVFAAIKTSNYKPPGKMDKNNNKSYWVVFCKSVISIAKFLDYYPNSQAFDKYVLSFYRNKELRIALPLLLKHEIHGFGFALACDFLKENGYPGFIKPDTHLNYIARELGISDSDNDYGVFKDMIAYCQRIKRRPYEIDKLFWLVGSGNFYLSKVKAKTSKKDFVKLIKRTR